MSNKRKVFILLVAAIKYAIAISILFVCLNRTYDNSKEILDKGILFWGLVIMPWIIGVDSIFNMDYKVKHFDNPTEQDIADFYDEIKKENEVSILANDLYKNVIVSYDAYARQNSHVRHDEDKITTMQDFIKDNNSWK